MHHHTRWLVYVLLVTFILLMGLLFKIKLEDAPTYTVLPVVQPPANPFYDEVREKETL